MSNATEDWADGYDAGIVDGLNRADMFNGYLAAMKKDQRVIFGVDVDLKTDDERRETVVTHAYSLIEECVEMMREVSWKPWKRSDDAPLCDPLRVAAEAADALHFLAHVLNYCGVDDDMLNEAMHTARAKNARRQAQGYKY